MDILTAKGQVSLAHEMRAAALLEERWPAYRYVSTPKDQPAAVDALLVSESVVRGVVETKCRDMSVSQFIDRFKGKWLITAEKLEQGREVAYGLRVPFVGCLYLIPDDTLLVQSLTNAQGEWLVEIGYETTVTQATINGGYAERLNGFVDMRYAQRVHGFFKKKTPT